MDKDSLSHVCDLHQALGLQVDDHVAQDELGDLHQLVGLIVWNKDWNEGCSEEEDGKVRMRKEEECVNSNLLFDSGQKTKKHVKMGNC